MVMKKNTEIVFTGDISFSKFFYDGWRRDSCISLEIQDYLSSADYVVANIESPLTNKPISTSRVLNHVSDLKAGKYLASLNIKVWSIANNHIMDCGVLGLKDTIKVAKQNECMAIGAGNNLTEALTTVILGESVKVGILSIASSSWSYIKADEKTPGAATWDKIKNIKSAINNLRKKVDWVVVVVHGGDEYSDIPLPYVRKQYHRFLELGVDIIVGHHPHVVQNYEKVGKKIIFYSLGNFIFDTENQRGFSHTERGVLIRINFSKSLFSFEHLPVLINRKEQMVEVGVTPVVFCNIDKKEYSKLWPLQARVLYPKDLRKRKKQSVRLRTAPAILVFGHELLACYRKKEFIIQFGRLYSLFGGWKRTCMKTICNYLLE